MSPLLPEAQKTHKRLWNYNAGYRLTVFEREKIFHVCHKKQNCEELKTRCVDWSQSFKTNWLNDVSVS